MSSPWLSIFLSALTSGLLSLVISHAYYRITVRGAEAHHAAQMSRMEKHHAEQVLVLRTTLLAVEKDSGVLAARDPEGNLTGGVHHEGEFTAVPAVSASALESTAAPDDSTAELQDDAKSRESRSADGRSSTGRGSSR